MSYFSKSIPLLVLATLLFLTTFSGCIQDSPNDTDIPWAGPASWEGTMPLPGSVRDRYQ
ncbi:MAG: hypothetical protein WC340_12365 [Kiritimatiellia bacterium]